MYRSFLLALAAVLGLLFLVNCATEAKNSKAETVWLSNMHRLSASHQFLLSWSADNSKFSDPRNKNIIKEKLNQMNSAATELVANSKAPSADPMISFFSEELASEVRRSYSAFEMEDLQMAKFALARTSTYCIACHTRSDRGIKNFPISWNQEISNLNSVQKIELMLANRHYESGYNLAKNLAADKAMAQKDPRSWILVIEKALGMSVRVNNSPDQAEQIVTAVAKNTGAPSYIRRDAFQWNQDIQQWKKDSLSKETNTDFNTAIRLVSEAQKLGGSPQTSLVKYLRASGILHALAEDSKSSNYGNVLLNSGIVSEYLKDLNMGFLDQYYYASCINHVPHSQLAERCYARFENSIRKANPFLDLDPKANSEVVSILTDYRIKSEVKTEPSTPKWKDTIWDDVDQHKWKPKKEQ